MMLVSPKLIGPSPWECSCVAVRPRITTFKHPQVRWRVRPHGADFALESEMWMYMGASFYGKCHVATYTAFTLFICNKRCASLPLTQGLTFSFIFITHKNRRRYTTTIAKITARSTHLLVFEFIWKNCSSTCSPVSFEGNAPRALLNSRPRRSFLY